MNASDHLINTIIVMGTGKVTTPPTAGKKK